MRTATLAGDEGRLFRAHHAHLVRLVAANVNASLHTVEDACAFAWMQLLHYQPDRRHLMNWLMQVATREVWRLTAQEWRMAAQLDSAESRDTAESVADSRIRWVQGAAAVATLRPDERRLLLLSAAGYSYSEISAVTGHSERAVERRLKRARDHAREALRRGQRRPHALHS